jgi:hypothetical protein
MSGPSNAALETLRLVKEAMAKPNPENINKAYNQALGLTAYDLSYVVVSLYPVLTPIRNATPRVKGGGDTATRWRGITAINVNNLSVNVTEGNRGAVVTTSVANYTAPYCGIGLEDYVTFEADYAAETYTDVKAQAALRLLQAVMIGEESLLLGGNFSLAMGTTGTPTLAASASGGTIGASITVSVICVALGYEAYRRFTVATGLTASIAKTNVDGSVDNVPGGFAQKSAAATVAVSAGATNSVGASVAAVNGAVAYAWYAGTAGNERLFGISTINSIVITSLPGASQLASALPASDSSANTLGMDGYMTFAFKNGGVVAQQATGVAGTGTPLTSDSAGGVAEIATDFQTFWDSYRLSPSVIWANSQEIKNITKKVISSGGAPLFRVTQAADVPHSGITGGALVTGILNPFTGQMVDLKIHPNQAPGTLFYQSTSIPYPLNNVPNIAQVKTRQEYYQLEWPVTKRRYEYGVYADEVLQVYAPFALGVRTNIGNG